MNLVYQHQAQKRVYYLVIMIFKKLHKHWESNKK